MKCKSIIFLFIVCITNCCGTRLSAGDTCLLTTTGRKGKCIPIQFCDEAKLKLWSFRIPPQVCGHENNRLLVCCKTQIRKTRTPGVISKQKCREYSAYRKRNVSSPLLIENVKPIEVDECGHKVVKLIVGGEKADRKEFPHMAAIGFEPTPGKIQWSCGGTIISNEFILTAAHCLSNREAGEAKYVKIGVTNLKDKRSRNHQQIEVADRIFYPQYINSSNYHDIALLRLKHPAKMTPYARPACLYSEDQIHTNQAIATGWGHTKHGEGSISDDLMKVTLDIFKQSFCKKLYLEQTTRRLSNGIVDDLQLCAGYRNQNEDRDTCHGDSGGPLQIYHDSTNDNITCMYDVIGITSFGNGCSGSSTVYTRVSHYIKWIENNVWPLK